MANALILRQLKSIGSFLKQFSFWLIVLGSEIFNVFWVGFFIEGEHVFLNKSLKSEESHEKVSQKDETYKTIR